MIGVYIVAGYPDIKTYINTLEVLNSSKKIDFVEIGVPFNDPVADGPVIAKAIDKAVKNNYSLDQILEPAREILLNKKRYIMTYSNLVYNYPVEKFLTFNGLIIADCPNRLHSFFYKKGINIPIVPFATYGTKENDLKVLKSTKAEFIYFIGLKGTTGGEINFTDFNFNIVEKIKKATGKKVIWGFGVKNKYHIEKILNFADGVIIGTEIVKTQSEPAKLKSLLKQLQIF